MWSAAQIDAINLAGRLQEWIDENETNIYDADEAATEWAYEQGWSCDDQGEWTDADGWSCDNPLAEAYRGDLSYDQIRAIMDKLNIPRTEEE